MFGFLKKSKEEVASNSIVAPIDGEMFDISKVSDPVFAEKMMGDGIAFKTDADKITVCSPADGSLEVVFPTGHAFGVKTAEGVDLLIHIGINTVEANGDGFKLLGKKQGSKVKAGDPIVEVDVKKLSEKYEMPVMLIITDDNGVAISFLGEQTVTVGQNIRG